MSKMIWRCLALAAAAGALLAAAGCSPAGTNYERGEPPAPEGSPVTNYRIVPGDVISIEGGKHTELSKDSVQVDEKGEINLLYVGKVEAKGKTKSELEAAINAAYVESEKYKEPRVTVTVLTLYYFVDGQVRLPGKKPYLREITLYRAIVDAGGFGEFAAPSRVLLMRPAGDGKVKVYKINVTRIMKGGPDRVVILPNDVIRVPKTIF
jgi:protein involved in polysaccharide export with SLBB domain